MEISVDVEKKNGFRVLKNYPDFLKVWLGQTISRFGDALDGIAFMWLMYKLTGSTLLMGSVMAVSAMPSLFGMAAGVFVDRMDKKKVMVIMDLLRGVSTAGIAVLFITDNLQVWLLFAFSFFNSICEVFSSPARSSAMQVLVKKEHYLPANSLGQASRAIAEILGMGIAAAVIGLWGVGIAILIDASTFLISAFTAAIANIEKVVSSSDKLDIPKFFKELFEGLTVIRSNLMIFINMILGSAINILLAPFNVLMPIYSDKILNSGEKGYSSMGIGIMVGTVLGSLLVGQIAHKFKKSTVIITGFLVFASNILALGLVSNMLLAVVFSTFMGVCLPLITATGMSVIQAYTPKEKMGRVTSTSQTIGLIGMPLGFAASGIIGESLNVQYTFIAIGVIMIIICIIPMFNKEFMSY
ncbi:MFS transporter [Clostridium swellfunianum]|uniref:MFS transporter n=1 Tax=Clostridium swellfunianum TaxID=1367462 RepID=UPI00202FEA76|nr:MFS transporter [Clostridium swellfunianum]MCM0650072.1 MFS transporter [Clostridium swellfunianum]